MIAQAPSTDPLACSVCGSQDARSLASTALASDAMVVVCGSHAIAHARLIHPARTIAELRSILGERRETDERRAARNTRFGEADELAQGLAAAFAPDRRGLGRRRADA